MKILKQIQKHNLRIVAVHPYRKIFMIFTEEGIYVYGEKKEVDKVSFKMAD